MDLYSKEIVHRIYVLTERLLDIFEEIENIDNLYSEKDSVFYIKSTNTECYCNYKEIINFLKELKDKRFKEAEQIRTELQCLNTIS